MVRLHVRYRTIIAYAYDNNNFSQHNVAVGCLFLLFNSLSFERQEFRKIIEDQAAGHYQQYNSDNDRSTY